MIEVPFWGYRGVLSVAQIMIMSADVPHTLFLGRNDERKGRKEQEPINPYKPIDPDDPSIRLNEESLRRARERRRNMEAVREPLNLKDIFKNQQPA